MKLILAASLLWLAVFAVAFFEADLIMRRLWRRRQSRREWLRLYADAVRRRDRQTCDYLKDFER